MKAIKNIKILHNHQVLEHKALLYDKKIIGIMNENELDAYEIDELLDGAGLLLSAGFIDVHVHGCSSIDVMDSIEDNIERISRNLAKTGVTAFLPTTMTMDFQSIATALEKIGNAMKKSQSGSTSSIQDDANASTAHSEAIGAQILGAHMEGPFISKAFKGAHDEHFILNSDRSLIEKYKHIIKIITIAPELDGSTELIRFCHDNHIIPSIGHTSASYEQTMEALTLGACHFTHTFNAMTPLKHREPGAVGAALLSDATCELIADNIHVHPAAQKLLVKMKGVPGVILITDAMRACLMGEGIYNLGGQEVIVKNREARMKDGTLAGSVLTLNTALKHIVENTGLPLAQAIDMLTVNQAKLLGLDHSKGLLADGFDADFTLFDENYDIHYTFVDGTLVYQS